MCLRVNEEVREPTSWRRVPPGSWQCTGCGALVQADEPPDRCPMCGRLSRSDRCPLCGRSHRGQSSETGKEKKA